MGIFGRRSTALPTAKTALAGRGTPILKDARHFVSGRALDDGWPEGVCAVRLGMGCFWGAERLWWPLPGVWVTSVGYAGGFTPNPTYEETCTGQTGHTEVVEVVFDPTLLSLENLLQIFWENHDPTQGMAQGNDAGSQYRSAFYTSDDAHLEVARASGEAYGAKLQQAGFGPITTEIAPIGAYYLAEIYHQQYLAKNPGGYCGLAGTGVSCPVGLSA